MDSYQSCKIYEVSYHWHLNDLQKDRPNYSCGLSTTTIEDSPYGSNISAMDHVRK